MAKQLTAVVRLQCVGGQATPAPPVGPALGAHGVNIGQFVSQFNERTKDMRGITIPVVISVFSDRSFTFETKSPPAAILLKQAAGIPMEKKKGGELIPAEEAPRRVGDPPAVWADTTLAGELLGWRATRDLDDIIASAWRWHSRHPDGYEDDLPGRPLEAVG